MPCPRMSHILLAPVTGLILLAGCGQANTTQDTPTASPPDPRVAVSSWWTGGGQDRLSAISTDFAGLASTRRSRTTGISRRRDL